MGQALKFCTTCENKRGCDQCADLHEWIMEHLDAEKDVAPVRYGRWIQGNGYVECSECHTMGSPHWKCCPICTAMMDSELGYPG